MKLFVSTLLLLSSLNVFAINVTCSQYEAQIIAEAEVIETLGEGCLAKVKNVDLFQIHQLCPLLLEDIFQEEVYLDYYQCEGVSAFNYLSGVLVQQGENGQITLE